MRLTYQVINLSRISTHHHILLSQKLRGFVFGCLPLLSLPSLWLFNEVCLIILRVKSLRSLIRLRVLCTKWFQYRLLFTHKTAWLDVGGANDVLMGIAIDKVKSLLWGYGTFLFGLLLRVVVKDAFLISNDRLSCLFLAFIHRYAVKFKYFKFNIFEWDKAL